MTAAGLSTAALAQSSKPYKPESREQMSTSMAIRKTGDRATTVAFTDVSYKMKKDGPGAKKHDVGKNPRVMTNSRHPFPKYKTVSGGSFRGPKSRKAAHVKMHQFHDQKKVAGKW